MTNSFCLLILKSIQILFHKRIKGLFINEKYLKIKKEEIKSLYKMEIYLTHFWYRHQSYHIMS